MITHKDAIERLEWHRKYLAVDSWKEIYDLAIDSINKIAEIEMIVDACEGCDSWQGYKEYPESKAYEDIKEVIDGEVNANDKC